MDVSLRAINGNIGLNVLEHLRQVFKSRRFSKFDYGPKENQRRYNFKYSPKYNLSLIEIPITLMSGESDDVATKKVIY